MSQFKNGRGSELRYLVEVGTRCFLVNPVTLALIEALQESSDANEVACSFRSKTRTVASLDEISRRIASLPPAFFDDDAAQGADSPIACRLAIVPPRWVRRIARWLSPAFSPIAIGAFALLAVVAAPFGYAAICDSVAEVAMTWRTLGVLALGFLFSALVHELGHASAVAHSGEAPGHIGVGLYWFWPVFYTDVNAAWRLPPSRRLLVDAGGLYFQLVLVILLIPFAIAGTWTEPTRLLIAFNLYSLLQNLNPVFKLDGYWILADAARIPNLHTNTLLALLRARTPRRSGGTHFLLLAYAIAVGAYFTYLAILVPGFVARQILPRLSEAAGHGQSFIAALGHHHWRVAAAEFWAALEAGGLPAFFTLTTLLWAGSWIRRLKFSPGSVPGTPVP